MTLEKYITILATKKEAIEALQERMNSNHAHQFLEGRAEELGVVIEELRALVLPFIG